MPMSQKPMGNPNTPRNHSSQKPNHMWNTIKRLISYMRHTQLLILITVLITILGTLLQVLTPKMLGNATNLIFNGIQQGTGIDFKQLKYILFILIFFYTGSFLASFLQQRFITLISQKATYLMRNELKAKMNRVPISYFDQHPNGELMSIAINDVDNIVTNLQQSLIILISSLVLVVGVLFMMFSISLPLTLLACITIPSSILVMKLLSSKIKNYNESYFHSLGTLNTQIEETYQGFIVIKSFNGEENAIDTFRKSNTMMYQTGWKMRFLGGLHMPSAQAIQNIFYILLAAIGSIHVVSGSISIGNIQALLQYSTQLSQPILQFSQIWSNILSMMVSAERVFEILDTEEITDTKEVFPNKETKAKVSFEHVSFGYGKTPLITDFSMDVLDGQMVAIVGHTGAGKTTLIHLIERFYEIQGGGLWMDGIDIRNMTYTELRSHIGMVLQDTWLFSGTIYNNIKYGNENATDKQIYAAAKAAYADDFISKLPDGYQTVLGENADNISQGQRQLITIARAFVSNPDILILDEATSNVDSRTELVIQKAMKRLLKNRTSFVVAHRLSTIYDADRILVMDQGNIVETGTHKELLLQNGTYSDIYNSQFAGNVA